MKRLILAIRFLTVIPIKKKDDCQPSSLSGSMAYFPIVGALQGGLLALICRLLDGVIPWGATAVVLIACLALTNNGLHLDGFADTIDGLSGGQTPERRLEIMRDHRVGAMGAVALTLLLLLKYSLIRELPREARVSAVFLFPVIGRWAMTPMAYWSDYARREDGLGRAFSRIRLQTLVISTALATAFVAALAGPYYMSTLIAVAVEALVLSRFFKRKLGGVTGDVFGFQSELGEAISLLSFTILLSVDRGFFKGVF